MNKKKVIIIIALVMVVLLCISWLVYDHFRDNAQYGLEMYKAANAMSSTYRNFETELERIEKRISDGSAGDLIWYWPYFDLAADLIERDRSNEYSPLSDLIQLELEERFTLYYQRLPTGWSANDEELMEYFADPENMEELAAWRECMHELTLAMIDFSEYYNSLSEWEKHTASWEAERERMSAIARQIIDDTIGPPVLRPGGMYLK